MFFISLILVTMLHPFYVSVTDLSYHPKTKNFDVSSKLFFDDFEKSLEKDFHQSLDIINPKDKNIINNYINKYFQKHFKIKVNGQNKTLRYIGYEINDDAAWCYFEVDNISNLKDIEITNDLLLNLHSQQINIVNVKANNAQKNLKLDNNNKIFYWKKD